MSECVFVFYLPACLVCVLCVSCSIWHMQRMFNPPPRLSPTVIHSEPELLDHRQVPTDSVQAVHVQTCGRGKELWVKKKFCTPCLYITAPWASCLRLKGCSLVIVVTKNVTNYYRVIFLLNEKLHILNLSGW